MNQHVFKTYMAIIIIAVLVFTIFGSKIFKRNGEEIRKIRPLHYFIFFLIGLNCGYIFVGTGYLVLLVTMGLLHFDIVKSNVIKNFIILLAIPFSLVVFVINGDVNYAYGLIHGAGNMMGAFIASHYAIDWGTKFLRWFMVVAVLICLTDVLGLISIREFVLSILN